VALAQEGRAAVAIALGLVVVLLISGLIEAFVTPSGLPTWARIGIGVGALAAFLAYIAVYGSRAVRAGFTGDLTGPGSATELAPMSG
jgi:cytosine/uracil/thiamine/allantoin permease